MLWYKMICLQKFKKNTIDGLTRWGQVTHIGISKLTIIGSNNGLWLEQRQAII